MMVALEDGRAREMLGGEELRSKLDALVRSTHLLVNAEDRKLDDLLSHWVLALAFCANEESRRRFVQFESELFRLRFSKLSPSEVAWFVDAEQVGYDKVSEQEMRELEDAEHGANPLEDVAKAHNQAATAATRTYYRVKFQLVCDLVRQRKVFVKKGLAYVPQSELVSALTTLFKAKLNDKLLTANRTAQFTLQDERMGPLLVKLQGASVHGVGADLALLKSGAVTLEHLPALAKRSFPACARELERALTTPSTQRFMNDSRQQYILFLKGIGLSMDDCLAYFQREFLRKNLSMEDFKKKGYGYTVQHNYGQLGKRANYAPWSCVKAISQHRTASEHVHGCSFKELSPESLAVMLRDSGVSDPVAVRKIQDLAKAGSFQLACRMQWEVLHPGGNVEPVGNHPNAWFDASVRYHEDNAKQAAEPASSS